MIKPLNKQIINIPIMGSLSSLRFLISHHTNEICLWIIAKNVKERGEHMYMRNEAAKSNLAFAILFDYIDIDGTVAAVSFLILFLSKVFIYNGSSKE